MGQFNYRMVWPMLYNLDNLTDKPMRLQIGVYDFDLGKDDLIGEVQLNIDDMLSDAFKNRERNRFIQVGQMPNPDPNPNPTPDPSPSPRPSPSPNPNPTPNPKPKPKPNPNPNPNPNPDPNPNPNPNPNPGRPALPDCRGRTQGLEARLRPL
jgi:outer membrane biosynthesis protein TonB